MQKTIIYLTLLIEVLGISIIIPAFPELKAYYGVGDFGIIIALTIYSLCAFFSAPILGQLSDQHGRKISLTRCIIGTSLSYLILLIQPRYWIFILSRLINGITGGNTAIIQAIVTDISPDEKTKNANFGLLGAMFGLGFIIGPVLGSLLLSRNGVQSIFIGGAILAGIQGLILQNTFTNTNTPQPHHTMRYNPFKTIQTYINRPSLAPWLRSLMVAGIGIFIVNSSQSLYMFAQFNTPGTRYGFYLSGIGIIIALNLAVFVPRIWTKYFSTKQILLVSYTSAIIGYTIVGQMDTELGYVSALALTVLLSGAYQVIYTKHIMSQAAPHETGELSGSLSSIQSITMIIGPLIGGLLLQYHINIHRGAVLGMMLAIIIMYHTITTLPSKKHTTS